MDGIYGFDNPMTEIFDNNDSKKKYYMIQSAFIHYIFKCIYHDEYIKYL